MSLHERLCAIANALPSDGAAVTLTRADLVALIGPEPGEAASDATSDLTVEQVAVETGRAPSTIRSWLIAGDLRGYKLNGRDWRVPRSALRDYIEAQAAGPNDTPPDTQEVDITAWRRVRTS